MDGDVMNGLCGGEAKRFLLGFVAWRSVDFGFRCLRARCAHFVACLEGRLQRVPDAPHRHIVEIQAVGVAGLQDVDAEMLLGDQGEDGVDLVDGGFLSGCGLRDVMNALFAGEAKRKMRKDIQFLDALAYPSKSNPDKALRLLAPCRRGVLRTLSVAPLGGRFCRFMPRFRCKPAPALGFLHWPFPSCGCATITDWALSCAQIPVSPCHHYVCVDHRFAETRDGHR